MGFYGRPEQGAEEEEEGESENGIELMELSKIKGPEEEKRRNWLKEARKQQLLSLTNLQNNMKTLFFIMK